MLTTEMLDDYRLSWNAGYHSSEIRFVMEECYVKLTNQFKRWCVFSHSHRELIDALDIND